MQVSLNWVKKYVALPADLGMEQIAYDLTMRTVEVEKIINVSAKFDNMVVGRILEVLEHPNADLLKICLTDIGEDEPVRIVCGGSNLYAGERVAVCKPGAMVRWHGEGEPVEIKATRMRGELSCGMICGADEVYLEDLFPQNGEKEIIDLSGIDCEPGRPLAEALGMDDTILEIDNKSLTNRPDLWGHYGIAREIAAIYGLPLKPLPENELPSQGLPPFPVDILSPDKCLRYAGVEIRGLDTREAPLWIKRALISGGLRPINAIVDITNYVMLAVGQPTHAFDSTHVSGGIVVRNAAPGEKLELLDRNRLDLTESDLVICDEEEPMALAGIRGGRKDSILPETKSVLLEVATFAAQTIRRTGRRFDEKTDASIRYEKGLDTQRVDQGLALATGLFREIFPECRISAYGDCCPAPTRRAHIELTQDFLDVRLGRVLGEAEVESILGRLGFDVKFAEGRYEITAPSWRSTGDISIKDDILDEIARLLSFDSFERKPLPVSFDHAVHQLKENVDRRIREYLALRCGFNEIFTYPWIDDKYIKAAGIDTEKAIRLATPPAPELAALRSSLIPGLLEAVEGNLRWFGSFRIFEAAEVFAEGEYHESSPEETLPVQRLNLAGSIVGDEAAEQFYEIKGIIEGLPRICHLEPLAFAREVKPSWSDAEAWLNIMAGGRPIGAIGLVSAQVMNDCGIRRKQVAAFELDETSLTPLASRDNRFEHLPQFPEVEEDLSILVDEDIAWRDIYEAIKHMARDIRFVEEYRGRQVPGGKKSVTLRLRIGSDKYTLTAQQIEKRMRGISSALAAKVGAVLRA